jgi:putative ABC transport system substrate-binding protein
MGAALANDSTGRFAYEVVMRCSLLAVAFSVIMVATGNRPLYGVEPSAKIARLGVVSTISPSSASVGYNIDFWERLRELGWTREKNLLVEEHWAEGHLDRMPALMAEVVAHKVDVILTTTEAGALPAKRATNTIPIVATSLGDPVGAGLAASLARPGGNVTGLSLQRVESIGKCMELLREVVPRASVVAVLWNSESAVSQMQVKEVESKARAYGIEVRPLDIRSLEDLPPAFDRARGQAQAVLVLSNPVTYQHRRNVTTLAAKHHLPALYTNLEFVPDSGLLAYAADLRIMYRRAADYVDKILKGVNPAEIPIEQATEYKVAVNLKTANTLRLKIPESILLRADEVIK